MFANLEVAFMRKVDVERDFMKKADVQRDFIKKEDVEHDFATKDELRECYVNDLQLSSELSNNITKDEVYSDFMKSPMASGKSICSPTS